MSILIKYITKWFLIAGIVGVAAGSASAFFLASLEWVTEARTTSPWLLWLLPAGGD
ncbi:hypothetical protein L1N85_07270 [Paenibacillus alkaliterrae]|uniref:hypothetical protein n=1 Tax=Paenibacillus alkaliterrae TaxID=320909 RepID=UPI001F46E4C2|nr:hypothetical protein [Paenibacillus alkaliterrae]MCF2938232.1 hypothetical protein [Paenibacillus alkaliterrae]